MRKGAVLLLLVLLLSAVRVAGARTEPGTPLVEPPGPAYAIADEQFISGTLRDQLAVARFLEAEGSILAGNELEPVSGRPASAGRRPAPVHSRPGCCPLLPGSGLSLIHI